MSASRSPAAARIERLESRRLLASAAAAAAAPVAPTAAADTALPARQMENLDRGVVAVRASNTQAFISWRLLGLEPDNVGFNVYRCANGAAPVKLNASVLTAGTNYTDSSANFAVSNSYTVRAVINNVEQPASRTIFARVYRIRS